MDIASSIISFFFFNQNMSHLEGGEFPPGVDGMIFRLALLSIGGVQLSSFNCWEILRSGSQLQIKSGATKVARISTESNL